MNMRAIFALLCVTILAVLPGCGGGGDGGVSGSGTGTVAMDIADAKPFIDGEQPDELWLVFEEVLAHISGGGWVSLNLSGNPLEINLLAFSDGQKTELVTPTEVPAGRITQIRFVISRAYMVFYGNPDPLEIDLEDPKVLRTDKQVEWWVEDGGTIDVTAHFDLSQSIVQTGPNEYKLKPVIHLFDNDPQEAATICGKIAANSFVGDPPGDVIVTVIWNGLEGDEIYTRLTVARESESDPTDFCICWLVPLAEYESYTVNLDNNVEYTVGYDELEELEPDNTFHLNNGEAIEIPTSS